MGDGSAKPFHTFRHSHQPIFRVVRREWPDPLDASFSQSRPDRRWNTWAFPTLYCCCSEVVARAVTRDLFQVANVELEDLQKEFRPQLAEISWQGEVVDMVGEAGVEAAGFTADYPAGVSYRRTQPLAQRWHTQGVEGVCCRSASAHRRGRTSWQGEHADFGEVALFTSNVKQAPELLQRRGDLDWLRAPGAPADAG